MSAYIPEELRARIQVADRARCAYCLTGETIPLFNPRKQKWQEHFEWSADGTHVQGLTAVGRATILALQMNRPPVVAARRRWVSGGWHPPTD